MRSQPKNGNGEMLVLVCRLIMVMVRGWRAREDSAGGPAMSHPDSSVAMINKISKHNSILVGSTGHYFCW